MGKAGDVKATPSRQRAALARRLIPAECPEPRGARLVSPPERPKASASSPPPAPTAANLTCSARFFVWPFAFRPDRPGDGWNDAASTLSGFVGVSGARFSDGAPAASNGSYDVPPSPAATAVSGGGTKNVGSPSVSAAPPCCPVIGLRPAAHSAMNHAIFLLSSSMFADWSETLACASCAS